MILIQLGSYYVLVIHRPNKLLYADCTSYIHLHAAIAKCYVGNTVSEMTENTSFHLETKLY